VENIQFVVVFGRREAEIAFSPSKIGILVRALACAVSGRPTIATDICLPGLDHKNVQKRTNPLNTLNPRQDLV